MFPAYKIIVCKSGKVSIIRTCNHCICQSGKVTVFPRCIKLHGLCNENSLRDTVSVAFRYLQDGDENPMCIEWAGSGECEKNPGYMNVSCKSACAKYGKHDA
jgi:hypothetical protein